MGNKDRQGDSYIPHQVFVCSGYNRLYPMQIYNQNMYMYYMKLTAFDFVYCLCIKVHPQFLHFLLYLFLTLYTNLLPKTFSPIHKIILESSLFTKSFFSLLFSQNHSLVFPFHTIIL